MTLRRHRLRQLLRRWVPLLLPFLICEPGIAQQGVAGPTQDPRSTTWLGYTCSNSLGRRDITLFANGTVRLREGLWESQAVYLHELGPEELEAERELLIRVFEPGATSRQEIPQGAVVGEWVERCEVVLEVPGSQPLTYRFGQFEVPPLEVARLVQMAEDLAALTRPLDSIERLPASYQPRSGDILIDAEGGRFLVIGLTADGKGLEVESLTVPMRYFHALDALPGLYVDFESRSPR